MRVMSPTSEEGVAICSDPEGRQSEVMVGLVGPVQIGDTVLVHAGTAILHLGSGNGDAA
ncbi:MAG TPA: HypC/HybG/HupF family hydrogenase formation chaperone [Gemmatimonadaceae bacterium]|nr:HypC/HybG/HupF family hydrogenase formation chaperone [Gemmatimonadaceae bacterium]